MNKDLNKKKSEFLKSIMGNPKLSRVFTGSPFFTNWVNKKTAVKINSLNNEKNGRIKI